MAVDGKILEPDARGRVTLGSLATHDRYFASVDDLGRVILEPAVVLTAASLVVDAGFRSRVEHAHAQPAERFELEDL